MGAAVEKLKATVDAKDRHDIPYAQLLPRQIAAANERLKEQLPDIRLLANRIESVGTTHIGEPADLVPLLLDHTAYKTYPESWFTQGKWKLMGQWLESITPYRVEDIDIEGIKDVDEWIDRLADKGHYVSCSSGTTGKCSMLPASAIDRDFTKRNMVACFEWTTGIAPCGEYSMIGGGPLPANARTADCAGAIIDAYGDGDPLRFPGAPITVGQVSAMVALRRSIADGTAMPDDIRAFEEISGKRAKMVDEGRALVIERLIANRHKKLVISGMLGPLHQVATEIRARGFRARIFTPTISSRPPAG